jgi:hypothetical protein
MARILDAEIEQIKTGISLQRLVEEHQALS